MFNRIKINGKTTRLYYHMTDGGAEYLTDKHVPGIDEGMFEGAKTVIRVDGGELEIIRMEAAD